MSLLLKITLSILLIIVLNGSIGIGLLLNNSLFNHKILKYYAYPSVALLIIAIVYVPFMLIWHLY